MQQARLAHPFETNTRFRYVLLFLLGLWAPQAAASTLPVESRYEINHILTMLKTSDCQFNRNGIWYNADAAQSHLRRKLDYLVDRGAVASTEQFIERAATKSSFSGKSYLVKCGNDAPMQSSIWLSSLLHEVRAALPATSYLAK